MKIDVVFGALAPPLYQQLGVAKSRMTRYQQLADAATLLTIHQCLRESEVHRIRRKLMRLILADMNTHGTE